MNRTQLSAIMQIVNKLGWNDMPAHIALDAVQIMVNNYISGLADCTEDSICEDTALDLISNHLEVNNIWLTLFIHDYDTLNDTKMQSYALLLRADIEESMRNGETFTEARREWDV
jgi:predicted helicase